MMQNDELMPWFFFCIRSVAVFATHLNVWRKYICYAKKALLCTEYFCAATCTTLYVVDILTSAFGSVFELRSECIIRSNEEILWENYACVYINIWIWQCIEQRRSTTIKSTKLAKWHFAITRLKFNIFCHLPPTN